MKILFKKTKKRFNDKSCKHSVYEMQIYNTGNKLPDVIHYKCIECIIIIPEGEIFITDKQTINTPGGIINVPHYVLKEL